MGILGNILGSILPFRSGGIVIDTPKGPVMVKPHTRSLPKRQKAGVIPLTNITVGKKKVQGIPITSKKRK